MSIVGLPGAVRRGRFALLAAALAVAVVVPAGVSGAATGRAKGIDVSNWNGTIDWSRVASAGYRFAFGKATEGTAFTDGTYATNRAGSEAAGLVFGAYHFARPSGSSAAGVRASAIAQADYFLSVADPQPGELPPVLDLEKTGNLSPTRLNAWTKAWVLEVYARTGVQPFVYSSPAFWQAYLGDSIEVPAAGALLWIAHWTSASSPWVPAQNWDGQGWTFWQWTDCVSVPGIAHCTDGDRMNGSQPASVTIEPYDQVDPPALATPPTVVGPPESGKLLAAIPGTWTGGKPVVFTYQWKRCDAAGANCVDIPGATKETYRAADADVGHSLKVMTTATATSGMARALTPPTVAVSPAGTPPSQRPSAITPPKITGKKQVGQALASSVGTWSGSPTKFAYKWQRCNPLGASCVTIPKATRSSYTLTPDDLDATLALVVTATGPGGAASARAAATDVVVAAPLPPVSTGSQTVVQGVAGNVQTADGRAVATWQPGAVPVGLTFELNELDHALGLAGSGVSIAVPGLAKGFRWPVDLNYATAQPAGTVLGYSTDGVVYSAVPALSFPALPVGQPVGSYVDDLSLTHVLTKLQVDLALFTAGAWGDPTYTSAAGPALAQQTPLHAVAHRPDHTVLFLTRFSTQSQTRLTATLTSPTGRTVSILPKGSRFGAPLAPGRPLRSLYAELDKPGSVAVRLRLNGHLLPAGRYTLRIAGVDPWGRTSTLALRLTFP